MKKKIEKWIDVHWKIVLVLIILIAPIGIYILSLKYSIGTKKELSADSIFSGLTTYVGVIISIYGIYQHQIISLMHNLPIRVSVMCQL